MEKSVKLDLEKRANEIRLLSLEAVFSAQSGHPGGSLSIAEIMSYLYFYKMNVDPSDPKKPDRDRFVLSKGHASPGLYSALALKGFFPTSEMKNFRHKDSFLQGHPTLDKVPGVDMTTGSLGQGFSASCGMAIALRQQKNDAKVYVMLGDGELEEGQVWEAAMFAAHYKLRNLTAFVDFNGLQIDGDITEVMNPTPIDEKFAAFGWHVQMIDGHNFDEIDKAVTEAEKDERPSVIVCKTAKGKGVSFMENNYKWHGSAPNKELYEKAVAELGGSL
ncbi:MAG: transketolase [Eubacteriales bacterium]|nr:transketolase [Eubacteriales bacterium]MDD4474188.1 transketolase [Eubacteriales bacterium]